jgi:hypothetical protein
MGATQALRIKAADAIRGRAARRLHLAGGLNVRRDLLLVVRALGILRAHSNSLLKIFIAFSRELSSSASRSAFFSK